ncbi:hypothetical protein NF27_IC00010 [Candidatus Jidaibacter acanthamoeba]|uniref:Uncharacterized protein n=1 Tax=Candidatus Jidaibacter acanthamoebae TaxID=86105 RepID=A0A0C1QJN8_9RICK|nr:hypothetical protein [Candidatus Jidaibacter acanthamoeba]KIE04383.1 hypothetical protein NF27_IC00010 [Candidatus Jidaibacter acanthamoeba]
MNKEQLECIAARNRIIAAIQELSDKDYQNKIWADPNYAHAFWDSIRFPEGTLIEEMCLDEYPAKNLIGYSLLNEKEAELVEKAARTLDKALDEIGIQQPDSAYINSPLWEKVIRAAKEAYDFFKKQGFDNEYLSALQADIDNEMSKA